MSGQNQPDQTVLFVGNLPWAMDSYGLRKVFETCGEVLTAQISFDNRNDRSRGFGHVVFKDRRDAEKAIRTMNNREVGGRSIQVYISQKPRAARNDPAPTGGRVDLQAMRVNPAAEGQRYGVSQEKLAYRYARDWVESGFADRINDPALNLAEDEWHPVVIEDDDDQEDWSDYKIMWDKWDPEKEEVVFGYEAFVPLYQDKPIDWDMDFNADPKQVFGDGTVHMIADPARPVKEDFDRIFIENDQRFIEELQEMRKNGTIIESTEYQVATRARDEYSRLGRGRRDGTNIVDPFGKRNVRRGLRERANSQSKAIIDRMKQQEELLKRTLSEVQRDPGDRGNYASRRREGQRDWNEGYDARGRQQERNAGYNQRAVQRQDASSGSRLDSRRYSQAPPPRGNDRPPPRTEEPPPPYGAPRLQRRTAAPPSAPAPVASPAAEDPAAPEKKPAAAPAKRRGRPPKAAAPAPEGAAPTAPAATPKKAAPKKAAPKKAAPKKAAAKKAAAGAEEEGAGGEGAEEAPKKKRGRPRQRPAPPSE